MARTAQPAKWFRDSVARGRANGTEEAEAAFRDREIEYLKAAIRDMRKLAKGYEAKDGYTLHRQDLTRLSGRKLAYLKGNVQMFRREMSQPHKIVRPRTAAQRKALDTHTGAKRVKGRKVYVVHVEKPETTDIKIETPKGKPPRVVEKRKFGAVTRTAKFFYFTDYTRNGERPATMAQIEKLLPKMLADMPAGNYVFVSSNYGNISTWMDRDVLLRAIRRDWMAYDKRPRSSEERDSRGLAETLVGFRFVGTDAQADKELDDRQKRQAFARRLKLQPKKRSQRARMKGRQ